MIERLHYKGWKFIDDLHIGWRRHLRFEKKYRGKRAVVDMIAELPMQVRLVKPGLRV